MNDNTKDRGKYIAIASLIGIGVYLVPQIIYSLSMMIFLVATKGFSLANIDQILLSSSSLSVLQFVGTLPLALYSIYAFRDDYKRGLKKLKEGKTWIIVIGGFVACLVLTYLLGVIYTAFGITDTSDNQGLIEQVLTSSSFLPMVLSVVILAPIGEEILFRKMIFGVCEETLKWKPIIPIIISTVLFAFVHVAGGNNLIFIFQYLPLAFVLTYSYYISDRNILVPTIIHFLNNTFSVISVYVLLWIESTVA